MTDAEQLYAIAEHLKANGWDTHLWSMGVDGYLDRRSISVFRVNKLWFSQFALNYTGTRPRCKMDCPVDAFNAIADAAGVPQLEAAQ
jgi:hypothetical protein